MPPSPRRALAWSFAERYAGLLISVVTTMILARLLTPTQVGIYSLCGAFTAVAGILRDFGVSEYLIQEKALTHQKIRAAYGIAFIVAWSLAGIVFLSAQPLAGFYREPEVAKVMVVLALHFAILPVSSPTFALLNRDLAFRQLFFIQFACNAAQSVTSLTLAWLGYGVMSLAWGPIANVAALALILMALRPRECLVWPSLGQARSVLRFGTQFVSARAIEVLTRNVHEPVIGKQFSFAAVGLFSRAFGLIELFNLNVAAAVIRVATPVFAAEHRAGRSIAEPFLRATCLFTAVSWSFFGFVALMAEPIIHVMFGHQWLAAAPIASILAVASIPQGAYALAPQMLSATGHVNRRLRIALLYSPLHIAAVLLASRISVLAVASVWILTNSTLLLVYLVQLRRALGLPVARMLGACRSSAVVAGVSVGAAAGAALLVRAWALPELLQLIVAFISGVGAFLAGARWLGHPVYDESMRALAPILRWRSH